MTCYESTITSFTNPDQVGVRVTLGTFQWRFFQWNSNKTRDRQPQFRFGKSWYMGRIDTCYEGTSLMSITKLITWPFGWESNGSRSNNDYDGISLVKLVPFWCKDFRWLWPVCRWLSIVTAICACNICGCYGGWVTVWSPYYLTHKTLCDWKAVCFPLQYHNYTT